MKILIADDERMVRLGLISMIEELFPDKYTYLEASNGEDALIIANKEQPSLAFLDIRMPNKDGLTVLKELKDAYPQLQIAILTGFAEFDYAQKAIQYGVQEYLLKPCSLTDIELVINKMDNQFHSEIKNQSSNFSSQITNMMDLYFNVGITPSDEFDSMGPYTFSIFYMDAPLKEQIGNQCNYVIKALKQYQSLSKLNWCTYFLPTGELCILSVGSDSEQSLLQFINALPKNYISSTTQVYMVDTTLKSLLEKVSLCQEFSYLRCFHFANSISLQELLRHTDSTVQRNLSHFVEIAALSYNLNDETTYKTAIMKLENRKNNTHIIHSFELTNMFSFFQSITGYPITAKTLNQFIDELPSSVSNRVSLNTLDGDIIDTIKDFINKNFDQDISIKKIGELFNISPNYLSKIFHDKTGMCYIDYLTEIRINAAKDLLRYNTSLKIQEISIKVGYYSTRHFTKTFQKNTGLLPVEYRKSLH